MQVHEEYNLAVLLQRAHHLLHVPYRRREPLRRVLARVRVTVRVGVGVRVRVRVRVRVGVGVRVRVGVGAASKGPSTCG